MRILLTARRGFDYNRVLVLLSGLQQVAPEQFEVYAFGDRTPAAAKELQRRAAQVDVVYVPPFRRLDVAFIKQHVGGKPVVFDPLIGSTITRVEDYGYWWRRPYAKWIDRRDYGRADHLIFDTEAHRQWSINTLGLSPKQTSVLYIGADTQQFQPSPPKQSTKGPVKIGFYGSLAPLQGVETILRAAALLQDESHLQFELIGNVAKDKRLRKALQAAQEANLTTVDYLPFDQLEQRLHDYDICLGIFGTSVKADVVIPNKIYHYAALGKPIITRDTPGMREHFQPGQHFHPSGTSAADLAASIQSLAADLDRAKRLGDAALSHVHAQLTERHVARAFLEICESVLNENGS